MAEESKFEKYLLSEYSNIAQAHFKSIETISTFFRHYLLIMAIPISVIGIVSKFSTQGQQSSNILEIYKVPVSVVLLFISWAGLGVFSYVTNLRLDTILYARVVNGIRKYFYDESNIDINLKLRIRALTQSPQLPPYYEKSYFFPVVFVFSIVNSLYLTFGSYLLFKNYWRWLIPLVFFISHWVIYWWYARHREIAYLKSNILGVDIDGVLNEHRKQFCSLLSEKTGKKIKPEDITVIPVHEHPTLAITRDEEREVFNDPLYWKEMPVVENAGNILEKISNTLKIKVYLFTWRAWPDAPNNLRGYVEKFLNKTENNLKNFYLKVILRILFKDDRFLRVFKEKPLKYITKEWLKKHNFKYKKFVFEKGNDYSSDPRGRFNNRFYVARKKKIKFFVEDDLEKAVKLSYICDIVFLLSHPYNEPQQALSDEINALRKNFPSNIIRVKTWNEIYKKIRKLS